MKKPRRQFTLCQGRHSSLFWLTAFVTSVNPTLLQLKLRPCCTSHSAFGAPQIITTSNIALMESREDISKCLGITKDGLSIFEISNFLKAVTLGVLRMRMRQLCAKGHLHGCNQLVDRARATHSTQVLFRALELVEIWVV